MARLYSQSLAYGSESMPRRESEQYHIVAVQHSDQQLISTRRTHMGKKERQLKCEDAGGSTGRPRSAWDVCMWEWRTYTHSFLTFCCLHSLQAFRQPPRRFPVTGGTFSISLESGVLCSSSTSGSRGRRGDRKSLGEIKCGPSGARRFRYPKSIRIGLCLPDINYPHTP